MCRVLDALDAFYQEHRRCGKLDTGIEGSLVWMSCTCEAVIVQPMQHSAPPIAPLEVER
jgi:hypothetical protein